MLSCLFLFERIIFLPRYTKLRCYPKHAKNGLRNVLGMAIPLIDIYRGGIGYLALFSDGT